MQLDVDLTAAYKYMHCLQGTIAARLLIPQQLLGRLVLLPSKHHSLQFLTSGSCGLAIPQHSLAGRAASPDSEVHLGTFTCVTS